jgi:hypothetical protein
MIFSAISNNQGLQESIMQKTTSAIVAISIAAIVVTMTATNGILPTTFLIAQSAPTPNVLDSNKILGHVTYVVRGPDGNIKEYVQTDNTRTVQGINCAEQILFNGLSTGPLNTNGTNVCGFGTGNVISNSKFNGFRFIGLINGSGTITPSGANPGNGTDLPTTAATYGDQCGCGGSAGPRASSNDGFINHSGIAANEGAPLNGTVAGTSTYNQITITSPAFAFSSTSGMSIRGSMLVNSTDPSKVAAFAENAISPSVTVGKADTLTVTWTITLT